MSTPRQPSDQNATGTGSSLSANNESSAELTAVVDELLNTINTKLSNVSSELLAKMDDMSRRLDNLEATIQSGEEKKRGLPGSKP